MKRILTLLVLITISCTAQQKQLDSLLNDLKSHPQQDTFRLKSLLWLAYYSSTINPNQGIKVAQEAIALGNKLKKDKLVSKGYVYLAENYQTLGKDSIALGFLNMALKIKKQMKDSLGIAVVYQTMGISYFDFSQYNKALQYEEEALQIFKKIKDTSRQADVMNSLGVNYEFIGAYSNALSYFFQPIKIWERTGQEDLIAYAYTNIGLAYNDLNEVNKALNYHFKSAASHEKTGTLQAFQIAMETLQIFMTSAVILLQPSAFIKKILTAL